jgi:hypothetical protein
MSSRAVRRLLAEQSLAKQTIASKKDSHSDDEEEHDPFVARQAPKKNAFRGVCLYELWREIHER